MPDHVEQLNGPEDGRGSLLPSVCSFGHSTGRYLFCLCSLNLVTSASLLYPSEKPGSLGMTPCFSHPFGGNHKFLLRCYTLTFFFFLAVLGLHCCTQAFLYLRWARASHGLQYLMHMGSVVATVGLWRTGLIAVAHGLSCSWTCWIFLDQGSDLHLLHWQADSLLLSH